MGIIARQSIKGSIANYIGVVLGFITTFFVVTHFLTAEEIGLTRILIDASTLFSSLAMLGTSSSAIRYYPYFKDEKSKDHGFFSFTLLLPFIGFLIFTALFFCLKGNIVDLYSDKSQLFTDYVYILLPLTFFTLYISIFESNANVLMRITIPKLIREVGIRLCNLITYLLYGFGLISLDWFVILFSSAYAIAALLNFIYLITLKKVSFHPDWKHLTPRLAKDIAGYTLMVTVTALINNIGMLNSLFIGAQGGLALAGIYTIAQYIANVISIPSRSLNAISGPVLAQYVKDKDYAGAGQFCKQMALHNMLIGVLIFFFIAINIDCLFTIIPNGEEYRAGISVVYILGVFNIINLALSSVGSMISFSKYYALSLPFSIVLMVSTVFLNITLIPILGINGSAIATLSGMVIYLSLIVGFTWLKFKITPFSKKMLSVLLLISILYAANYGITLLTQQLFGSSIPSLLCEAALRSGILAILCIFLLLKMNISENINNVILRFLHKIKLQ